MPSCTFLGHGKCSRATLPLLRAVTEELIVSHNIDTFYVGNGTLFYTYVQRTLRRLQEKYPQISWHNNQESVQSTYLVTHTNHDQSQPVLLAHHSGITPNLCTQIDLHSIDGLPTPILARLLKNDYDSIAPLPLETILSICQILTEHNFTDPVDVNAAWEEFRSHYLDF